MHKHLGPRFIKIIMVLTCLSYFLVAAPAHADDETVFIIKKQHEKELGRWSLEDWLETRDRMRLMDLWFALHTPSPYEFYFGGNYVWGPLGTGQWSSGWRGFVAAYASIFGLEVQREFSPGSPTWLALFHLRIFGLHAQATNLTLEGGARNVQGVLSSWDPEVGVTLTLYLRKYFGIEGLYRHYFVSTIQGPSVPELGDRVEAGAFIDFSFCRIFADYFRNWQNVSGDTNTLITSGGELGTKIFF